MKKLLIITLLLSCMSFVTVEAQRYGGRRQSTYQNTSQKRYGMVSDPDGYTNIRVSPSVHSQITRRYSSGNYLYYIPLGNGWSKVYSGVSNSTFMGYMHTSRIVRVNPNRNYY